MFLCRQVCSSLQGHQGKVNTKAAGNPLLIHSKPEKNSGRDPYMNPYIMQRGVTSMDYTAQHLEQRIVPIEILDVNIIIIFVIYSHLITRFIIPYSMFYMYYCFVIYNDVDISRENCYSAFRAFVNEKFPREYLIKVLNNNSIIRKSENKYINIDVPTYLQKFLRQGC